MNFFQRYTYSVFYAFDTFVNSLIGGPAGQTISARLGEETENGDWAATRSSRALDSFILAVFGQAKHCEGSWAAYEARAAVAPFNVG